MIWRVHVWLQTSQHDPQILQTSLRAGPNIVEDAHNTIDDSGAAANIQPEIAAGVTYTIQAFHGILQMAARQGRFEEVATMKANYWRRTLRGRRTRYSFSPLHLQRLATRLTIKMHNVLENWIVSIEMRCSSGFLWVYL